MELFGEPRLAMFGYNGVGASVSTSEARSIAEALQSKVIAALEDDD